MRAARQALRLLAALLVAACLHGQPYDRWVPVLWDGGPLALALREKQEPPADPAAKQAIAGWYRPETLALLEGSPFNCLLLTLSAGADPATEKEQHRLVREYARLARARNYAVLGLVHAGADPDLAAAAAAESGLDGLVAVASEETGQTGLVHKLREALGKRGGKAIAVPLSGGAAARRDKTSPLLIVNGAAPGIIQMGDAAEATATGGLWINSSLWLVRSLRPVQAGRPVWVHTSPPDGGPAGYLRPIADAATAGARWIVALDDGLRSGLFRKDAQALSNWSRIAEHVRFFEANAAWREFAPFGTVGIILDSAGPDVPHSEEYLNLIARRQIPYRVIERSQLTTQAVEGLRAVIAFDLAPPTEAERKVLTGFARKGGLLLGGPSWGKAPTEQSYAITALGEGEVAVYKDAAPDPQGVARDLNDLLTTPELGVSVFDAPSVLSYAATAPQGKAMLIHLINYAGRPAEKVTVWATGQFRSARLISPGAAPQPLPVRLGAERTEVVVPNLAVYGALWLE